VNKATSYYLDLIRFIAAMAVFQSHASMGPWTGGFLRQLRPLGMEAVVIFFVLSGFVIGFVTKEREGSAGIYAVSRLARVYSVCLPALLITFGLDAMGRSINPEFYSGQEAYSPQRVLWLLMAGTTFTTEVWWNHIWIGINSSYWSMGYEVPYYVAFGLAMFLPRYHGLAAAALLMAVVGPNVAVLFPVWLLGVICYRVCARWPLNPGGGLAVWVASIVGLTAVFFPLREHHALWEDFSFDLSRLRDYGHFYVTAVLFAANIVGFRGASPCFESAISKAANLIRWCAETTFTVYLLHLPVIQFVAAIEPWPADSWIRRGSIFVGVPVIVMLMAHFIERRKAWWRNLFSGLLGVMSVTTAPAAKEGHGTATAARLVEGTTSGTVDRG